MAEYRLHGFYSDLELHYDGDEAETLCDAIQKHLNAHYPLWAADFRTIVVSEPLPFDMTATVLKSNPERETAIRAIWPKIVALRRIVAEERAELRRVEKTRE